IARRGAEPKWTIQEAGASVTLKTSRLQAIVSRETGAVRFTDASGRELLREREGSRELLPQVFDGEPLHSLTQEFATTPDDAWYGLGQHQDGMMNYKGHQVFLFQNNTEVAVPFLISRRNYGILWDNSSLTRAGDIRPYLPLSALQLFSATGEKGWLTATYINDRRSDAPAVVNQRPESGLNYEFLNDSKLFLPPSFKPENGLATWEGYIASGTDGLHAFRFTYGGYLKVWVNDSLLLDRWRQAWNPGTAVIDIAMKKGVRSRLRIEWIPDGSESYLSAKWLPPVPAKMRDGFGFASEAGKHIDYYFIAGQDMDGVIAGYRKLTGKAVMLPRWAFGKWQSRERYKTAEEMLEVATEFRKRKIPIDN
ncbi:MAG TPA: TIM-barrel domain-containing protein, partial [Anseongella sp.]|nr:TIM-barrel domain-containing protein [Anseongella sp.]